jgi:hypothetical protein
MSATTSAGSCETTSVTASETTSDDKCNDKCNGYLCVRRIDKCEDFFSDMTFLVYCYVLCVVLCKWPDESIGKIFRLRGPYGESAAPSPLLGELNWNSLMIKKKKERLEVGLQSILTLFHAV